MNLRMIAKPLGHVALSMGTLFLLSVAWAVWYAEYGVIPGLLLASTIAWATGGLLSHVGRKGKGLLLARDVLLAVALTWVLVGILGALPFICTGIIDPAGAVFESVSGFTTTGASVLDNPEVVPRSILFWRALTHWFGGIGVIVLFVAFLPQMGIASKHLFQAETSPLARGALRPKVRDTALILCKIYLGLTVIQTAAYLLTGKMDLFESLCHTFATLATGGYSTRLLSIGAYNSVAVEAITIFFMICGASSFALYFGMLQGDWASFFKSTEWRVLILILAVAIALTTLNVAGYFGCNAGHDLAATATAAATPRPTLAHAFRVSAFNVTSMMTNTGFMTDDFDLWPSFSRMLLIVLVFIGGSAGSTSGGLKVIRVVIGFRMLRDRIWSSYNPHMVKALRVDGQIIDEQTQQRVLVFVLAYMMCFAAGSLVMATFGLPFQSAASAVAVCMSNTGPGLEWVGPMRNYGGLGAGSQLFLCGIMILGRLELFTLLVLFMPSFWREK